MSPPLPLAVVSCDFRVASSAWRGALVLSQEERRELAASLLRAADARGLVVIETCNRSEWLVEADRADWAAELLRTWMHRRWREHLPRSAVGTKLPQPHVLVGERAARHVVSVAVGLESFVPGERGIASQLNRAFARARQERTTSPLLNELGQACARAVRRVERACHFRDSTRGVHALALQRIGAHAHCVRRRLRVGIAGLGQVGRRVADSLAHVGLAPARLFNRTMPERPTELHRSLSTLAAEARDLDVLVVATGAREPVVHAEHLVDGRREPLLVLDLGVPAQVSAADAAAVIVEGLDELLGGVVGPRSEEDRAAADRVVDEGLEELLLAWRKSPAGSLLRHVQETRDELGCEQLPELLASHLGDLPPERRRHLETALRGLVLDRDRRLLEEISRAVTNPTDADHPRLRDEGAWGADVRGRPGAPS